MMPQRDLLLAAEHRILVPGYRLADVPDTEPRLIAARDIAEVSDEAFLDRTARDITFYNIVFDAHQVFCVNGLPVESYLPSVGEVDEAVRRSLAECLPEETHDYPARYVAVEDGYRPEFV